MEFAVQHGCHISPWKLQYNSLSLRVNEVCTWTQTPLTKSTMGAKDTLHPLCLTTFHRNQLQSARGAAASRCKHVWALPKYWAVARVSSKGECYKRGYTTSELTERKFCLHSAGWLPGAWRDDGSPLCCSHSTLQTGSDRPRAAHIQPEPRAASIRKARSNHSSCSFSH